MTPKTKEELTNIPVVDLGEIYLRAVEFEDYKDMFEYGSDDEVTKTLVWNSYTSIEEAIHSVKTVFLTRPERDIPAAYAIIHKQDQKMIGTCDFFTVDWETGIGEIGYVLNRHYWNKGYMTKVCKALIDFGFHYLGLKKIEIRHLPGNIGSKRVIEKCGFQFIGDLYFQRFNKEIPSYEMTKKQYLQLKKSSYL